MGVVKYTGPVASFHCPTNAEIRSLKVHFSPKQEGTGDPSPENVREIVGWDGVETYKTGKNLFNRLTIEDGYIYQDGSVVLDSGASKHSALIPVSADNTYVFSGYKTKSNYVANKRVHGYNENGVWVKQINYYSIPAYTPSNSYNVVFTIDSNDNIKYVKLSFENKDSNIQLELGSKATSYEPYHDEIVDYEFGVLGKNKFPAADGSTSDIFLAANTAYTLSNTSTSEGYFKGWYEDGTDTGLIWINAGSDGNRYWKTFTPQKNIIRGLMYVSTGMSECQIELGSTATAYEPYNPKNTVYGGWVDLISGEVCDNWWKNSWDIGADEGTIKADGTRWIAKNLASAHQCDSDLRKKSVCDKLLYFQSGSDPRPRFYMSKVTAYMNLPNDNSPHTITIWYPSISVTATYHLAPTELQTFLGQNNVWSNADYVEVEYDLHETQEILNRKAFIVANQPHLVALEAAQLQSFTTDVPAPLKDCKAYFKPKQSGEDDPSPENIRPIEGWNELIITRTGANILNKNSLIDGYISGNNTITSVSWYKYTDYIPCKPGAVWLWNTTVSSSILRHICFFDINKTLISSFTQVEDNMAQSYIAPDNTCWMRLNISPSSVDIAMVSFLQPINYNPYTFISHSFNFPSKIYGGYVDLVTGEVWKEWSIQTASTSSAEVINRFGVLYGNGTGIKFPITNRDAKTGDWHTYCTHLADGYPVGNWSMDAKNKNMVAEGEGQEIMFISSSLGFTTKQEWADWIINNNVEFAYPLANPILLGTITLPVLKTLRGTNNIWSSANDNIEIKYWKH